MDKRLNTLYESMKLRMVQFDTNPYIDWIRLHMSKKMELYFDKKSVSYFGMPSVEFYDINMWKPWISDVVSIEILENIFDNQLKRKNQLEFPYSPYLGDIDKTINSNYSILKAYVKHDFQLIFLDYWEDIFHRGFNRLETISEFIRHQREYNSKKWMLAFSYKVVDFEYHKIRNKQITSVDVETISKRIHEDVQKMMMDQGFSNPNADVYSYGNRLHFVYDVTNEHLSEPGELVCWFAKNEGEELFWRKKNE